jgi:hemolysin D
MAFGAIVRHWTVWKAAWQAESSRPVGKATFDAHATEFLPSVLEIQQAPPSPIGRALLWTIVAALTAGALWTTLGTIDIVATAQGKIIPSGYSKIIHPSEAGVIASIHVQDGQAVKQGDVLIELDPALNVADRARAVNEYRAAIVEAARLRALIQDQATFEAPTDADEAYVLLQQELLRDQLAEYHADVAAAQHLVDQRRAVVGRAKAHLRRIKAAVPMEAERAEAYQQLLEQGTAAKMDVLQVKEPRIDKAQELASQKKKLRQDRAALAEAEQHYRAMVSEFQQTKQAELAALETKVASLAHEVARFDQKGGLQRLVAPIDGVVRQLAVHAVGGVVTPAQPLLIVVPKDQPVEVEAQVENRDREFVRQGQPADIQVGTGQFSRYGTIPGRVVTVSDDAASIEKVGLVYPTRVSLDREFIQVEGTPVNLSPGMTVTVEIKTGPRRIIEYAWSLLPKSMKERLSAR